MRPVTKISILGVRLGIYVLVAYWVVIFVGTHMPVVPDAVSLINDKIKHFTAFFGLGTLLCYVTTSERAWPRFLLIGAAGMTYAIIDEWTQSFVPNRVPDIYDIVADGAGLGLAIGLYAAARSWWRKRQRSPEYSA